MRSDASPSPKNDETAITLVVDDDPLVLDVTSKALELSGFRVAPAASLEDARRVAQSHPVDALLCDVILPGGNGVTLAREVQALHPGARVILISGYPRRNLQSLGLDVGTFEVFEKPFRVDDLVASLRPATN